MGAGGAALWDRGNLVTAAAPKVVVKDTVGAGDAFMAGLIVGLTRGADSKPFWTRLAVWARLSPRMTERYLCCLQN